MPLLHMLAQTTHGIADHTDEEHAQSGGDQAENPQIEQHKQLAASGLLRPIAYHCQRDLRMRRIRLILIRL
jgi:hypothetical protein